MKKLPPLNKTKVVCTIGPACQSPEILEQMVLAGMTVARLNFSHGDFADHKDRIASIRSVAGIVGHRVAIMADLPGPKMRIGQVQGEPLELKAGDHFTLTADEIVETTRGFP
ncbi:MAG: pyruvate kinase [Desulfomonile sp.]